MALFNKLFPSRKNNCINQEYVSEKRFGFNKEQVRVVLFRECDFRGRKLLFDSTAIKQIQINSTVDDLNISSSKKDTAFAEISDGYGYMYIKPPADSNQLAEMIFGLVAMSYRGSYFKIHNLESPSRFMLTQVFPSPKYMVRRKSSVSSNSKASNPSLEHSVCLDDSGTSICDHLSVHSTASDTLLVCRHTKLDTSHKISGSSSSVIYDSGIYGERSCSSFDSSRHFDTFPFWESKPIRGSAVSFSNSTLYKRWLRSSSLEQSFTSSSGSIEEAFSKSRHKSSRLGLSFIIHLTSGQEDGQMLFLMEHIALLDSMLCRARQATEIAYQRPNNFLSILVKMVNLTSSWLVNLVSGPLLPLNLWTSLYSSTSDNKSSNNNTFGCDNNNSINMCRYNNHKEPSDLFRSFFNNSSGGFFSSGHFSDETMKSVNMLSNPQSEKSEFTFLNLTRIIKNEWDSLNSKMFGSCNRNNLGERFVQEFCELLDAIDVKDTNFFMSTLLTAVLTHHLGWVATCLPPDCENNIELDVNMPLNPFWDQLSDLYGIVGNPSKAAQTIILGNKKKEIVSKIITCLTYFIRCCDLERNSTIRCNIYDDNKTADNICNTNSCIPKENYKKYQDHLREMLSPDNLAELSKNSCRTESRMETNILPETHNNSLNSLKKGLSKSKPSQLDLKLLQAEDNLVDDTMYALKSNGLYKTSNWTNLKELNNLIEENNSSDSGVCEKASCINDNVVFVLGDDEKLINIRKNENINTNVDEIMDELSKNCKTDKDNKPRRKLSVPNFLDSVFKKYETFEEEFSKSLFKDEDFVKYESDTCLKPSTSWASLHQAEDEDLLVESNKSINENNPTCSSDKLFTRSQSVPPETEEKVVKEETKAKYRYSGVKFSLHQYPQVVTNYMRSKNLEMSNLTFSEITKKFDQISLENEEIHSEFSQYDVNCDEMDALETPSNASELEFTSDLTADILRHRHAKESSEKVTYTKVTMPNIVVKESSGQKKSQPSFPCGYKLEETVSNMKIIYFPMPKSEVTPVKIESIPYQVSLLRGLNDGYIPDLVLQGITAPKKAWESSLRNELILASQHSLLDQKLEEAVAIIADTDTWEVQLVSSHTYIIDKSVSGIKVGMSQLIASMLDSLLKMWKLQVPPHLCLLHIEQRLQALCIRSKALAQLLLATEFCSMEFLTSTLHLEVNDVPLLLAVASTYSPQVTQKYGISFQ